jgi:hypothetical protein
MLVPIQLASPLGVTFAAITVLLNLLIIFALVGGLGFFYLRFQSGGDVDERLDRMEREIGRLEAQVERLESDADD